MKIARRLLFLFLLCLLAAVAGFVSDKHLQASTSTASTNTSVNNPVPVTVTNTPLPVQGSVTVANGATAPVPMRTAAASAVTHMGQLPSSHVTLNFLASCLCFRRLASDGTIDPNAFTIPAGQVFVLTNVDWSETAINSTAGQTATLILRAGNNGPVVFDSRAIFNTDLLAGKNEQIEGGIVLSVVPQLSVENDTNNVVLAGYLMTAS